MAITILIVDDDKLLVDKLEETVNWSKIGIDMVFTANNIRQAQKLLEEYPIEMLLCDIDMPQGNGLELLEWIRYKKLDIECAFLSSYANFAYAQMALKLSSREYLLKPISNTDLEIALLRLVEIVKEKQQKTKAQENTEQKEKKLWEDLLIQCMQEEYWIEQAKKKYDDPEERFQKAGINWKKSKNTPCRMRQEFCTKTAGTLWNVNIKSHPGKRILQKWSRRTLCSR